MTARESSANTICPLYAGFHRSPHDLGRVVTVAVLLDVFGSFVALVAVAHRHVGRQIFPRRDKGVEPDDIGEAHARLAQDRGDGLETQLGLLACMVRDRRVRGDAQLPGTENEARPCADFDAVRIVGERRVDGGRMQSAKAHAP